MFARAKATLKVSFQKELVYLIYYICPISEDLSAKMSDHEVAIERVRSEQEVAYDKVPGDVIFLLKFRNKDGKVYRINEYVLKKGRFLPYLAVLKGEFHLCLYYLSLNIFFVLDKRITFSRHLKPEVEKMSMVSEEDENCFVFQDSGNTDKGSTCVRLSFS